MKTFLLSLFFIIASMNNESAYASTLTSNNTAGKAVLVTGASSGIGHQIALTLSENGFFVFAGARKSKDIDFLNNIPNMQGIRLDVTIQQEIDAAVEQIAASGKELHGLVNNAGVFLYDPLIEVSEEDMRFIIDVNIMGPYRVSKAFAPLLIKNKGRISTIGSVAGLFSSQLFGPYGMTKHAMEAFSEALAQEMKKFGVKVSIIEPGNFRSNIMKNMSQRLQLIDLGEDKTQFRDEINQMASFVKVDRSHHQSPIPVAHAVLEFMTAEHPKFRYLVTPNKKESDMAIKRSLQKLLELNQNHRFSLSQDELLDLLKTMLRSSGS